MNIKKIAPVLNVKYGDAKINQIAKSSLAPSGLPRELPFEKDIFIRTDADAFESVKNKIQISIDNMQR